MPIMLTTIDTIFDAVIGLTVRGVHAILHAVKDQHTTPVHEEAVVAEVPAMEAPEPTFRTVSDILKSETRVSSGVTGNTIMYAGGVSVPLYKNPTVEFDSQLVVIPYGEMVMMLEPRGRFFHVVWGAHDGWVLRDELVDRAARVYPEFTIGQENLVDHPNTAHVRTLLGDIFGLNRSEFPLQAGEYVLYRLWKKNVRIMWPDVRPRVPGLWHKILKGVPQVHIGVVPKAGAVMEYMLTNDIGHVAYVEAVFPDDTITVSEVNYPDSGVYNERELTKDEWKELKPVFIRIV